MPHVRTSSISFSLTVRLPLSLSHCLSSSLSLSTAHTLSHSLALIFMFMSLLKHSDLCRVPVCQIDSDLKELEDLQFLVCFSVLTLVRALYLCLSRSLPLSYSTCGIYISSLTHTLLLPSPLLSHGAHSRYRKGTNKETKGRSWRINKEEPMKEVDGRSCRDTFALKIKKLKKRGKD